jgi:hypothetical protein
MILELKPAQEQILEMAARSGLSREEVLDQVFEIIRAQHEQGDWMIESRDEIAAKLQRAFDQSERGELFVDEEAIRILEERHAGRQIA